MGTDISVFLEVRDSQGTWQPAKAEFPDGGGTTSAPFTWRSYGLFGFLADVRNYSHVPPICQPRGLPDDAGVEATKEAEDAGYPCSWLSLADLDAVDYDLKFWDRRVTKEIRPGVFDCAAIADEGEGEQTTLREFLGTCFFDHLAIMRTLGKPQDVRIIFWFSP